MNTAELKRKVDWVWQFLENSDPKISSMLMYIDIWQDGKINFVTHQSILKGYDPDKADIVHRTEVDLLEYAD